MSLCLLPSCQLDLSTLAKEQTHHLELPLEESRGYVVLLLTLTASAHVSIADLSVTPLDDPQERREILKRYVSSSLSADDDYDAGISLQRKQHLHVCFPSLGCV